METDHVLIVGFGGPTRPEEVAPFLARVTEGLNIPPSRLEEVRRHYERIGGTSPYNSSVARFRELLEERLAEEGLGLPVFFGLRNWHPLLAETLAEIKKRRLGRGVAVILASHRCHTSFDRYVDNINEARKQSSALDVEYECAGPWFDRSEFIAAQADLLRKTTAPLRSMAASEGTHPGVIFTAHSIPLEMAKRSRYAEEFEGSSLGVAQACGLDHWRLAYQSRSGNPRDPWLEPDIPRVLKEIQRQGGREVVIVPIGFVCENAEILYDLDVEVKESAESLGLVYHRAGTVIHHPEFVRMVAYLVREVPAKA
jgi:ferrochelatase